MKKQLIKILYGSDCTYLDTAEQVAEELESFFYRWLPKEYLMLEAKNLKKKAKFEGE